MPNRFRSLVISADEEFREELVERAVSLNLSVRAVSGAPELPRLLRRYGFDWLILDLGVGERGCLDALARLAGQSLRPRTILVGTLGETAMHRLRREAAGCGLEIVGVVGRPLSLPALRRLLDGVPSPERTASEADPSLGGVSRIPDDELVVHYQPIVAMADRGLRRVEALVRWQHPQHGLIRPHRFIAMFERADTIAPLTWEVLRRALDQHLAWRAGGLAVGISVNVSALFLASLATADEILALLAARGVAPDQVVLEVTESEATVNPSVARALLQRLRDAGVEISMDDFGVGFSDLERLGYFPFSGLKVDRRLVARLGGDTPDREAEDTVRMLVARAREQRFTLTGEGIETEAQWAALQSLGCDFGQGFLIARPMPGAQLAAWIAAVAARGRYRPPPG